MFICNFKNVKKWVFVLQKWDFFRNFNSQILHISPMETVETAELSVSSIVFNLTGEVQQAMAVPPPKLPPPAPT